MEDATDAALALKLKPELNLVGYWSFDAQSNPGAENSGKSRNAQISKATWADAGRAGGALQFNGTDAIATVADGAWNVGNPATYNIWYKSEGSARGYVLDHEFSSTSAGAFAIDAGGARFRSYDSSRKVRDQSFASVAASTWTMITIVVDGSTIRLYKNGVPVGSTSRTLAKRAGGLRIGASAANSNAFRGLIDEVAVFGRALKQADIEEVYKLYSPPPTGGGAVDPDASLLASWTFDDGTAKDVSGKGNDGEVVGASTGDDGVFGKGLYFDGKSYVRIPDGPWNQGAPVTYNAWIKAEGEPYGFVFDHHVGWQDPGSFALINEGKKELKFLAFDDAKKEIEVIGDGVASDVWTMLTVVFTGTEVRLYRDGELWNTLPKKEFPRIEGDLYLGASDDAKWGFFTGWMDEVSIYGRALSDAEVRGLRLRVDVSKRTPCQNEPVTITVVSHTVHGASAPGEVSIDGVPVATREMQFRGKGPYYVTVSRAQGAHVDVRTIMIDVKACPQVFPRIVEQSSLYEPYAVDFQVANAAALTGSNRMFQWDFGDGSTVQTPFPHVSHDYSRAVDRTQPQLNFRATVRVTRDGLPDAVASQTVSIRNHYAFTAKQGYVRPLQEADTTLVLDGKVLHGGYRIINVESNPITYTRRWLQKHFCDPERDPVSLPQETVTLTVPAKGELSGDVIVETKDFGSDVCAISLNLLGSVDDLQARTSVHFEKPDAGLFARPVTDPTVVELLNSVVIQELSSQSNTITGRELQRLYREGRIPFEPRVDETAGPAALVAGELGERCTPEQMPDNPALVCQGTDEWDVSPPLIRNALKGDVFIVASCGVIGDLLRTQMPRQTYTHEGIMTSNYYTLSHSTANEDRILKTVSCFMGPGPLTCTNIDENKLKFAWPGSVLNASIGAAFHGQQLPDPEGVAREISGFSINPERCTGDQRLAPPILIRPPAGDEAAVRPLLHQAADFAASPAAQGHYRWFGYSQANIAFDPPNNFSNGNFRGPNGDSATVSTSFIWHALKTVPGITLEGTSPEAIDVDPATLVDLPTGGGIIDGLYLYSVSNRQAGANQIFNSTQNKVKDIQEDKAGGFPGADWLVEGFSDQADDVANQFTNCFAFDKCGDDGAQDNNGWKNPGTGVAVSPDNFLHWDAPHTDPNTQQGVGVFGDTEFLLYRNAVYRRVHRLAPAASAGSVSGRVIIPAPNTPPDVCDGTAVDGAVITLNALTAGSGVDGSFSLPAVSAGRYEIRASKLVLASDPTQACPPPPTGNDPPPPPCINMVGAVDLTVAPGSNPPVCIRLAPEAEIPVPSVDIHARRVTYAAHVHINDDDDTSIDQFDIDVSGECVVSPLNREQNNVAIPAERNPRICGGGEVRIEITTSCKLLGDNETVQVSVTSDMFEGDSCTSDDHDDSASFVVDLPPCVPDGAGGETCPAVSSTRSTLETGEFNDSTNAFVDLVIRNTIGDVVQTLPDVKPENSRRTTLSGTLQIHDDESWPASDEDQPFDFETECLVDPFRREDRVPVWKRCGGEEVRVEVEIICRLAADNVSVDVSVIAKMFEGTTCENTDHDGTSESEILLPACNNTCTPTGILMRVNNTDEGGDSGTLSFTARNEQQ